MRIGCRRHDRLGAGDDDTVATAFDDMDVRVGVGLLRRPQRPIAFGVGHRDSKRQVVRVDMLEIRAQARMKFGALLGVDARGAMEDRAQRIAREIALRATGFLTDEAHRLELVEQVRAGPGDREHPVDRAVEVEALGAHQVLRRLAQREIVADANAIDTRREQRIVGHRLDPSSIDVNQRVQTAQRFTVIGGGHQHGGAPHRNGCILHTIRRPEHVVGPFSPIASFTRVHRGVWRSCG